MAFLSFGQTTNLNSPQFVAYKLYIYQELYTLTEHCNISHTEAWKMPVEIRKWWIEEKNKEKAAKNNPTPDPTPLPKSFFEKK